MSVETIFLLYAQRKSVVLCPDVVHPSVSWVFMGQVTLTGLTWWHFLASLKMSVRFTTWGLLKEQFFFKSHWYFVHRYIPIWSCLSSKNGIVRSKMAAWRPYWRYRKRHGRSQGNNFFQIDLIFGTQVHTHMKLFKFKNRHRPIQDGCLKAILVVLETTRALSREQFFLIALIFGTLVHSHMKLFKLENWHRPI